MRVHYNVCCGIDVHKKVAERRGRVAATAGNETQGHSVCAESNLVNHSPTRGG